MEDRSPILGPCRPIRLATWAAADGAAAFSCMVKERSFWPDFCCIFLIVGLILMVSCFDVVGITLFRII